MKDSWKFQYTAGQLLAAAQAKQAFYESRAKYWTAKKADVVKQIKDEGIEIDESVAADDKSYLSNSHSRGASVNIRNDLVKDLQECHAKTVRHNANVSIYDGWVQVLGDQKKEHVLELTHDDWLFFFSTKQ